MYLFNRICRHGLMFKKHYLSNTVHIVGPLCPASLKCLVFYKVPSSHKQSALIGQLTQCSVIHTGRQRQDLSFTLNGVTSTSLHWRCSRQKMKTFQLFKRQCRHQPIRSPYANTLVQALAHPVHATPEK